MKYEVVCGFWFMVYGLESWKVENLSDFCRCGNPEALFFSLGPLFFSLGSFLLVLGGI